MKTTKMTRKSATVTATYLPYQAYLSARILATAHNGKIGSTAEGLFKADFPTAKVAKAFVDEWTTAYEEARNARLNTPASKVGNRPNLKGVDNTTPTHARKRTGKGANKVDFGKVKGNTKSERNKAAHALIVGTGVKSGSEEYKALWSEWTSVR